MTTNAITSTVLAGTSAIWIVFLVRQLHWSPQVFALVMSIGASGGFLASLTTPRLTDRYGAGPVMISALTLAPVSQLPLLLAHPGAAGQLAIGCGLFAQLFGACRSVSTPASCTPTASPALPPRAGSARSSTAR
ncbi:hypothetical protein QA943_06675 [Streptomyces sp. B21-097]|uniref:hypothetical protein n=1 Tax=Streptomyces sp. B21-097 TaxID=3039414 RepID=UPI002FEF33E5